MTAENPVRWLLFSYEFYLLWDEPFTEAKRRARCRPCPVQLVKGPRREPSIPKQKWQLAAIALTDCLEAEVVPGYRPGQPPGLGWLSGLGPVAGGSAASGARSHGTELPRACGMPERNVRAIDPVPTTTCALTQAIWIPQAGRNYTKHFGDIWCVFVYHWFQASPLISRVGMP